MSPAELKAQLAARAHELGFIACGVARAAPSQTVSQLERWLSNGHNAGMAWMNKPESVEKRADIRQMLPGAQSVVVVAMLYRTDAPWDAEAMGEIARYARGDDYHDWMKARLRELLAFVKEIGNCEGLACVDTAPVLEREWAQRAGVGWIGKNSLLMNRAFGSYVLLGELVLDLELPYDEPHIEEFCGTCTRCMDACPTQALIAPRELDANKCIAYHTIENRELAPIQLRETSAIKFSAAIFASKFAPGTRKPSATKFFPANRKNGRAHKCPLCTNGSKCHKPSFRRA